MRRVALAALLVACTASPSDDDGTPRSYDLDDRTGCDPLDAGLCALPWPSSHFQRPDEATASGWTMDFGPDTLPRNRDGVQTRPDRWNMRDGYSINSAALVFFEGVSLDGTIPVDDIGAYADPDARTVLIDTETGERVPHWVELDRAADDDAERLLILRPAVPYEWGRRYVVGIRGLVDGAGATFPASEAFAALRDGVETRDPDVEYRRERYESEVFGVLEADGIARDELQLAWDFVTASHDNTLGDLYDMRDDALDWIPADGVPYEITSVEDRDCSVDGEHIARDIEGRVTVPFYTTEDRPSTFLARDEDGGILRMGERDPRFLIRVPCSVAEGPDGNGPVAASAPILQYGHGLLGGRGEARTGWLADMGDRHGWVYFAMDWTGFASPDVPGIGLMLALDPSEFGFITDRSSQGMIDFMIGMRAMITTVAADDALAFDGVSVVDTSQPLYLGNSQGAIMGTAYMGLSPDIPRGVLGVGGGPYSLLLPRSVDFDPYFRIFEQKYLDHRDIALFVVGLTQQLWDPVEPGGWMWDINRDTEDPKQLLMQVAIYDNQVTTLGAHIQARAYDAPLIEPATRPVWGLDTVTATEDMPWTGSALVEWEYTDLPPEPTQALPPSAEEPEGYDWGDIDPHECPRRERAAQEQVRRFLEEGIVIQTCAGRCVGIKEETCD